MRGTIRKRGNSWEWMHNAPPGYGRQYISGTRRTKREATAALAASIADHDRRQAIEPTRQLAVDYLAAWLEVRRLAVKPSTWRSDADAVRLHLAPHLKGVKLTEVSGVHLARTYEAMRAKGLSEKTVLNVHTSAHAAFAAAVKARFLSRNPCDEVQRPKPQAVQMRTWSAEQLAAFLDYTAGDRLHTLWVIASTTAMRRAELLGLSWEDVDLDARRLSIRRSRTSVGYVVEEGVPKTRRGTRVLDLDPVEVAALRSWRKRQSEERLAWGAAWTDSGLVFTREDGTGLHPDATSDTFDRVVKRSGLPKIRLHDLRHTWATLTLRAGVSPKIVSERLGHATVAFTMDVYAHAIPGWGADAAATFVRLVFGDGNGER